MNIPKNIVLALIGTIALVIVLHLALRRHKEDATLANRFSLYQIQELSKPHVYILHPDMVEHKLKVLTQAGAKKLQVIFDFDKTLGKYEENGTLMKTSDDIFNAISTVPTSYKNGAAKLYSMYSPIESDPTISVRDKLPFMDQWAHENELILKGITMDDSLIEQAVIESNLTIRDGALQLFKHLKESSVPVLVFSAGNGDVVKAALRIHHLDMKNVHVISNFFKYKEGKIAGYKGRHIHAFNKNQRILEEIDFKYYKELTGRSDVILVGDSLGDASMADGLPHTATVLRIGFLNDKKYENLPYYKDMFDVVIAADQTMTVVNSVFYHVLFGL